MAEQNTQEQESFLKKVWQYLKDHPIQSFWNVLGLIGFIVATAQPKTAVELLKLLIAAMFYGASWLGQHVPPVARAGVRTLRFLVIFLILIPFLIFLATAFLPYDGILETLNFIAIIWFGLGGLFLMLGLSAIVALLEKGMEFLPGRSVSVTTPEKKSLARQMLEVGIYGLMFASIFGIYHVQMHIWPLEWRILAFLALVLLVTAVPRKYVRRVMVGYCGTLFFLTILIHGGREIGKVTPTELKEQAAANFTVFVEKHRTQGDFCGKIGIDKTDVDFLRNAFAQAEIREGSMTFPLLPGNPHETGDMNGDGQFTLADADYLEAYVNGKGPAPVKGKPTTKPTLTATPQPTETEATVSYDVSKPYWTPTKFHIPQGATVTLTANGTFSWDEKAAPNGVGPDGGAWKAQSVMSAHQFPLPEASIACLIGKIGKQIFPIGSGATIQAFEEGNLELSINERWLEHCWNDNSGILTVHVKIS